VSRRTLAVQPGAVTTWLRLAGQHCMMSQLNSVSPALIKGQDQHAASWQQCLRSPHTTVQQPSNLQLCQKLLSWTQAHA
jgi:hypothetical protein